MTLYGGASYQHQHEKSLSSRSPNCGSLLWFHLLSAKVFGKSDRSWVTWMLIIAARIYVHCIYVWSRFITVARAI